MVWAKKSTAPAVFSLKNAMAAMIAGTEANWLTDWMFWIPDQWFDTTTFCTAGPPPAPESLTLLDALSAATTGRNPAAIAVFIASILPKLQSIANDRAFAAYCEQPGTLVGGWSPDICQYVAPAAAQGQMQTWTYNIPGTAATVRWRCTQVDGKSGSRVFYAWVVLVNSSTGASSHIGDLIDPTVPTSYGTHSTSGFDQFQIQNYDWVMGGTVCIGFDVAVATGHTPATVPQPANMPTPVHNTYTTIADLGAELDRQEQKLDFVSQIMQFLATGVGVPTGSTGSLTPVADNAKLPVGTAYAGLISVDVIPAAVSDEIGTPVRYRNLGYATTWTADGPLRSVPVEHNPQVVLFAPQVTDISVHVMPPAHASVRLLYPQK